MDEIKTIIADYLAAHPYLRLGTVNAGNPQVHTVGYVSEGCIVYFVTDKNSRKAKNIFANPAVAYAIDENYEDMMLIQGVQIEGKASVITLETGAMRLQDLMAKKFSGLDKIPPNPNLVFFRIVPSRGYFLDNSVSFGHRDLVEF